VSGNYEGTITADFRECIFDGTIKRPDELWAERGREEGAGEPPRQAGRDIGVTWRPHACLAAVKFITRPSETDYTYCTYFETSMLDIGADRPFA